MSDTYLRFVPTDPAWLPAPGLQDKALSLLRSECPAERIEAAMTCGVTFIDQGENFEAIYCPECGAALELAWWQATMDSAHLTGFTDLSLRTPCCRVLTSLNDLRYEMPAGFARFCLQALNPRLAASNTHSLRATLERVLGIPLREIWARY